MVDSATWKYFVAGSAALRHILSSRFVCEVEHTRRRQWVIYSGASSFGSTEATAEMVHAHTDATAADLRVHVAGEDRGDARAREEPFKRRLVPRGRELGGRLVLGVRVVPGRRGGRRTAVVVQITGCSQAVDDATPR